MSLAHLVLGELARIGAKIEPAGTQLILRAGPTAIPAELVRRVRDAKSALIEILSLSADWTKRLDDGDVVFLQPDTGAAGHFECVDDAAEGHFRPLTAKTGVRVP